MYTIPRTTNRIFRIDTPRPEVMEGCLRKLKEKEENDDEEEETWEPLPENTPIECAIVQNNQFKRILSRPFLGQKARTIDK